MQRNYDENNIFNKILKGKIPSTKVYEDNDVYAFNDIDPKAPVHILVIPKKPFVSFNDFTQKSTELEVGKFFKKAQQIAESQNLKAYRIMANCGEEAGQAVFHFHLHIMGYK